MQRRQRRGSGFMSAAAVALATHNPSTAADTWRERSRALKNTLQASDPILRLHDEACCWTQDDGSVKCWGVNNFGQLGYGDTRQRGDGSNGSHRACDGPALVMFGGCCFGDGEWGRMVKEACVGRRDGVVPSCGRAGNEQISCRGQRRLPSRLCVAGKITGRGREIDADEVEGQRWIDRAIPKTTQRLCCIWRDTAPAPRVRGSVDRPTMFHARDPYVLPHT